MIRSVEGRPHGVSATDTATADPRQLPFIFVGERDYVANVLNDHPTGECPQTASRGSVPLSDSLSNPGKPLVRLVKAVNAAGGLAHLQGDAAAAREELIAQTGADDATSVRFKIKENRKLALRPYEPIHSVREHHAHCG